VQHHLPAVHARPGLGSLGQRASSLALHEAGPSGTCFRHRQRAFFDAFRFVSLIGQRPLLMIVGREAVTSWMSIQAFQNATGPKELHWIDSASHNDLYYKEQYVGPAVTKLTGFFTKNLTADRTAFGSPSATAAGPRPVRK
jgi:fermentation-respiration switch protein FrsA (DUF1100 family)